MIIAQRWWFRGSGRLSTSPGECKWSIERGRKQNCHKNTLPHMYFIFYFILSYEWMKTKYLVTWDHLPQVTPKLWKHFRIVQINFLNGWVPTKSTRSDVIIEDWKTLRKYQVGKVWSEQVRNRLRKRLLFWCRTSISSQTTFCSLQLRSHPTSRTVENMIKAIALAKVLDGI